MSAVTGSNVSVEPGDVVQLDPESELGKCWGPQFVVVEEIKPWGFQGFFIHAETRQNFGPAYLRVKIGRHLQRLGAVAIKNSVYALPRTSETQSSWCRTAEWKSERTMARQFGHSLAELASRYRRAT